MEPVPTAGSAAALATATAAGLLVTAASASRDAWPDAGGVAAQAEALRDRAVALGVEAAEVYTEALALLAEPRGDDQRVRDLRLGEALSRAAIPPLRIAETAHDVAELGTLVIERADPHHRADAAAAVLLAEAAARIGAQLVRVNLTAQPGDERVARADSLVQAAEAAGRRALS